MKVRALRPFLGPQGMVKQGDIISVTEQYARDLESRRPNPLAVRLINHGEVAALKDSRKGVAVQSIERPTQPLQTGSQTGEDKPVSLSPQDPPRQKRKYTRRKARHG